MKELVFRSAIARVSAGMRMVIWQSCNFFTASEGLPSPGASRFSVCPGGTFENSPGFQAWDQPPKRGSSPEGTAENARIYRLLLFHAFLPVTIAGTHSRAPRNLGVNLMSSSRINAALAPVCVCASRRHPVRVSARQRIDPDGTRDGDRVNRVQPEMPDDGNGFGKHASLAGLAWVGSLFFN